MLSYITDKRFFLGMFPEMVSVVVSRRPICAYGGAGGEGGEGGYIYKNFIGQPNHSSSSPVSLFASPLTVQISSMCGP
jgi:hypothetical protein